MTDLFVDEFNITLETTGGDSSRLNGEYKFHNISVHKMFISALVGINQHAKKWCCASETSDEVYRYKIHISIDNASYHFVWYSKHASINGLRVFLCNIYSVTPKPSKLNYETK